MLCCGAGRQRSGGPQDGDVHLGVVASLSDCLVL